MLRKEAKEEAFASSPLQNYLYIHLATHGTFNRHKPAWSYLLFSAPQDTAPALAQDGLLTAAESYNLKLDSDLVTLSACKTARGELKPGEGLLGLTRGLLYSGARGIGFPMESSRRSHKQTHASLLPKFIERHEQTESLASRQRNAAQKRLCLPLLLGRVCFDWGVSGIHLILKG
jgi:hypothetical protein